MLDRGGLVPNGRSSSQLCILNTSVGQMPANDASERIVDVKLGTDSARHGLVFTLYRKQDAGKGIDDGIQSFGKSIF